jgi:hypothetical protein
MLMVFLFPLAASAHNPVAFSELRLVLHPGDNVTVTDIRGTAMQGKFESASRTSIRLKSKGSILEIPEQNVFEVKRKYGDDLGDGAKRGFWIGAALGLIVGISAAESGYPNGEAPLAGVVTGGVYGAGIGLLVDALKKSNETLYRAPGTSKGRITVSPIFRGDSKGAVLNLSF